MAFVIFKKQLLEFNNFGGFPLVGVTSKLYLDKSNFKSYKWNGLNYVYFDQLDENALSTADQATEIEQGIAEIATQAETNAGLDDTRIVTPLKLAGALSGSGLLDFVEEKTPIAGSNAGAWVVRNLGAFYANKRLEIVMGKMSNNNRICGVRKTGSVFNLSFNIRRSQAYRQVTADAAGDIEIFSNDNSIVFNIIGSK